MASQPQTIVQPALPPDSKFGARNVEVLKACFPECPVYTNNPDKAITDDERKQAFHELALEGMVINGLGFNSFNRDFVDAPNIADVETGGGGKPASPYGPNITSPGPGSTSAADQAPFVGELPDIENNIEYGSGMKGTTSPSKTSPEIARQTILGTYISGRSYQGSDGRS